MPKKISLFINTDLDEEEGNIIEKDDFKMNEEYEENELDKVLMSMTMSNLMFTQTFDKNKLSEAMTKNEQVLP
jgi:hypothetical protein